MSSKQSERVNHGTITYIQQYDFNSLKLVKKQFQYWVVLQYKHCNLVILNLRKQRLQLHLDSFEK